jgi:creatinine amidohydrolase/Fe(II)-dependent formamide hydrolase-like protein
VAVPETVRWETLTKRQFDEIDRERAVVFVTCSPLEVHGPHLPLGADAFEGEGLAEHTLRFLPERHHDRVFLKLPFIYAAADPVPQPGSVAFRPSTIIAMMEDLGRSLAAQGFRNVFVSNFHGSPRHFLAIETACDRVHQQTGLRMVCLFSLMLTRLGVKGSELGDVLGHIDGVEPEDFEGDTHGGLVETSQLLALCPQWVDPDYKTLPKRTVDLWARESGRERAEKGGSGLADLPNIVANAKDGLHYFVEESYSGSPRKATPELGEHFLDVLAEKAAEAVDELLEGELPESQWHSPFWGMRHLFVHSLSVRLFDRLLDAPKHVGG